MAAPRAGRAGCAAGAARRGRAPISTATIPSRRPTRRADGSCSWRSSRPRQGLGPLFNDRSCAGCHLEPRLGGMGEDGLATVLRVGRLTPSGFRATVGGGGPIAPRHAISELGSDCPRRAGIPAGVNVTSVRNAPALFGSGLVDAIPDAVIRAGRGRSRRRRARAAEHRARRGGPGARRALRLEGSPPDARAVRGGGLSQRAGAHEPDPHRGGAGRAGRGSRALRGEVARGGRPRGRERRGALRGGAARAGAAHAGRRRAPRCLLRRAAPPATSLRSRPAGARCTCTPTCSCTTWVARWTTAWSRAPREGEDWRTTPLWGLGERPRLLHDGRARSIEAAIRAHGGEAQRAQERFRALPAPRAPPPARLPAARSDRRAGAAQGEAPNAGISMTAPVSSGWRASVGRAAEREPDPGAVRRDRDAVEPAGADRAEAGQRDPGHRHEAAVLASCARRSRRRG